MKKEMTITKRFLEYMIELIESEDYDYAIRLIRLELTNQEMMEKEEETDCHKCIYLDVTNNEWVCEIKGNIDIELEKDCKEYVRQ